MQDMLPRLLASQVETKLQRYPAVAILGPRQCGKTTLARGLGGTYFDLETQGDLTRLDAEWDQRVAGSERIILDEVHHAPQILARLRGAIDQDRKRKGRFLLLGSVSPALMESASESLAGRLGLVRLTPLVLPELAEARADDLWLMGGYPDGGILDAAMFPEWQRDYLDTLVMRDLPAWGLPASPQPMLRLLAMIATLHGQPLNASTLGAALGLDHKTVLRRCDFLEGAFLLRRLPPFAANLRKRLVKTPRIYWRDSGLLHALMHVADLHTLYRQPWLGFSWEGFVLEQTLAVLEATGQRPRPHYFRTSDGYEIDLVLDWGTESWAVEVKITSDPSPDLVRRLHRAADLIGSRRRILVCRIAQPIESEDLLVTNLPDWLKRIQDRSL